MYVNQLLKDKKIAPRKDPSKLKKGEVETPLTLLGDAWAQAMTENSSLLHLDISYNQISIDDSRVFATALELNHTMWGLHYQGNCGEVDALQFLIPKAR